MIAQYLIHEVSVTRECEPESHPLFIIYLDGAYNTKTRSGNWLAQCDERTSAELITKALNYCVGEGLVKFIKP